MKRLPALTTLLVVLLFVWGISGCAARLSSDWTSKIVADDGTWDMTLTVIGNPTPSRNLPSGLCEIYSAIFSNKGPRPRGGFATLLMLNGRDTIRELTLICDTALPGGSSQCSVSPRRAYVPCDVSIRAKAPLER